MSRGTTCYERDEMLCDDEWCLRVGCLLENKRLQEEQNDSHVLTWFAHENMRRYGNRSREINELADWIKYIREGNEESIARNDPVVRAYVSRLGAWEKMLRELGKCQMQGCR